MVGLINPSVQVGRGSLDSLLSHCLQQLRRKPQGLSDHTFLHQAHQYVGGGNVLKECGFIAINKVPFLSLSLKGPTERSPMENGPLR